MKNMLKLGAAVLALGLVAGRANALSVYSDPAAGSKNLSGDILVTASAQGAGPGDLVDFQFYLDGALRASAQGQQPTECPVSPCQPAMVSFIISGVSSAQHAFRTDAKNLRTSETASYSGNWNASSGGGGGRLGTIKPIRVPPAQ